MLEFIVTNIEGIFIVITSVIAAASAVAALTPNKTDDGIINKIRQVIDLLALNIGNAATKNATTDLKA